MNDDVAALTTRVQALEDEREIRALLSLYAFTADLGLSREYTRLYTKDGRISLGPGRFGAREAYVGHDELYEFITGPAHKSQEGFCQHQTIAGPLVVHIDGDDAVAEGYSLVIVQSDENTRRTRSTRAVKPELNVSVANFNRWILRRVDGRWRIAERLNRAVGSPDAGDAIVTSRAALDQD